jgi:uncharacterized membrane protein YbhN (UPF0104 family)
MPGELGDRLEHAVVRHADAALELAEGTARRPARPNFVRTAAFLAITGISLYIVAPSLVEVFGSWKQIGNVHPLWLAAMAVLQTGALGCLWELQRLALGGASWSAVITSQLAGNAMSKIAPGGGAVGAALQYRMLVERGIPAARTAGALTAVNLLTFAAVLAMPVLAIPAVLRGSVSRTLVETAVIGAVVFVALSAAGAAALIWDGPLVWVGRAVQRVRNALRRRSPPLDSLPARLLRERDRILGVFGPQWKRALIATAGRWAFDYGTLLAALAAVGSHPRPVLVLLAFCAAQLLSQIPITPGGLGFVEAGLTAMLTLAGVKAGDAVIATFAYRLFSYWLMLPAGAVAFLVHRRNLPRDSGAAPIGLSPTA